MKAEYPYDFVDVPDEPDEEFPSLWWWAAMLVLGGVWWIGLITTGKWILSWWMG